MIRKKFLLLLTVFSPLLILAQTSVSIKAKLDAKTNVIAIEQEILYFNKSKDTLHELYLLDWANSFSSKNTPLAERFAQEFSRRFHYAPEQERGKTIILNISSQEKPLAFNRPDGAPDIIRVRLEKEILPGESYPLQLNYQIKIPIDKFTRYGYGSDYYKLRYWNILPAKYGNKGWEFFSNKNLNDQFIPLFNSDVEITYPKQFQLTSALPLKKNVLEDSLITSKLSGKNYIDQRIYLATLNEFDTLKTDKLNIITNIKDNDVNDDLEKLTTNRIVNFLSKNLGDYPLENLMVTEEDYLKNPIYGLNQLPSFISPFPNGFQYDLKLFKTITKDYLDNSILLNPRTEAWLKDAILIYLMMDYVESYYPDTKLLGEFAEVIGIRWFHASDLKFNDRYPYFAINMARLNLDQPLEMSQDSLIKFNKNIANPYKAGVGFNYINDYLGNKETLHKTLKEFYTQHTFNENVASVNFKKLLQANSSKDLDWFFSEYINTNARIDFSIKSISTTKDSLTVTVKNKEHHKMPISLYGIKDKKVVAKYWLEGIDSTKTITIPREKIERLALNYEAIIPEYNQRNNYKRVTTLLNKPIQLRLFEDIEDPKYSQLFLIPEFDYNLYDGFIIGPKFYNSTILRRNFNFKIAPKIGLRSKALVGSMALSNSHQFQNQQLNQISYGLSANRYAYAENLYYHRLTPYLNIYFRNNYLRSNERQAIGVRNVNVFRDRSIINTAEDPDYSVVDIQYNYSNRNFRDYFTTTVDYQIAKKFSKISVNAKWRKLFLSNRQIELRSFTGFFLFNHSENSDYFSFALDRPTDYLFDYNYYGRSENTGLFSQQFIEAEGGFKSKLQPAFANRFISTLNGSFTIWNWIHAYGDIGVIKNTGEQATFVYDSGVRVNLVQDYFEIFLPVYSKLGWETAQDNYDQRIRFIVSLDFSTLLKLFTRRWY
ncbi:metalloprotease [Mesonia aestuariivivens]|uniref:Metalloprotease n=1 Tax=Mesonia aestuariivivens TaxID=2796128 RepID=A0ABS6W0N3_9FLAO|nr:metalloprotease [Mesonia aestuariivivens]MBW2961407.1 metalloprotease [Mesonia aestuariivivens]